jgi:hypothetical protein
VQVKADVDTLGSQPAAGVAPHTPSAQYGLLASRSAQLTIPAFMYPFGTAMQYGAAVQLKQVWFPSVLLLHVPCSVVRGCT